MKKENIFALTKGYYVDVFKNLQRFQNENEKMVKLFLDQTSDSNQSLDTNYLEWVENTKKGFEDYQALLLHGLDYLAQNYDRTRNQPPS